MNREVRRAALSGFNLMSIARFRHDSGVTVVAPLGLKDLSSSLCIVDLLNNLNKIHFL